MLIVDYGTPRGCWPLGRIVTVFPGSDNVVRSGLLIWSIKTSCNVISPFGRVFAQLM